MKKLLNWLWPWPKRIRQLESIHAELRVELERVTTRLVLAEQERDELLGKHQQLLEHQSQNRRAMASLGIFIKRRHGLNVPEERMRQFIQ